MRRSPRTKKILFYLPRILTVGMILLLFTYAWGEVDRVYYEFGKLVGAIVRKLITPAIMFVLMIIAWRYLIFGGILFLILGILYFVFMWDVSYLPWAQITVGCYMFLLGVLFILEYERPMDTYD